MIAIVDGELTVKRLHMGNGGVWLKAESPNHPDIQIPELSDLTIWGVVTWVLHKTV